MKKIFATLIGISLTAAVCAQDIRPLEIGSSLPAADVLMSDVMGKEVNFEEVKKENGLLVMFSCNTCPYVIKAQQRTKDIIAFAEKQNIGMIIINSNEAQREEQDSREAMINYAKAQKYTVPYVVDEGAQIADIFGATRTPEVFLFNSDGVLMYHGAMEDNPASPKESKEFFLKNAIEKMLSGQKPDPAFTKSVGCSIKRPE